MAGFKTHITTSTILGIGYGAAGVVYYDVPIPTAAIAAGLCSVSGMLPDIDSDSGVPLRESLCFAAAVIPMMLAERLRGLGLAHEMILLISAAAYLFVRFAVADVLKRYTVHRGMFHSIPAMLIFGELAYLLTAGTDNRLRWFQAIAVMIGFASHLILDEIWAIDLSGGRLHLKHSFGTAIKFFGPSAWANVTTYAKLAILSLATFADPNVVINLRQDIPPVTAPSQGAVQPANPAANNPLTWLQQQLRR